MNAAQSYARDASLRAVLRVVREAPSGPSGRPGPSGPSGPSGRPGTASPTGTSDPAAPSGPPVTVSTRGLEIDRACRTAHVEGRELDLTYLEFELLSHLVAHPRQVHSRERLVSTVWGYGDHVGDGRTVDVHVARLRRKLGGPHRERIVTVRRVGYKFIP